jgi:hypothetical protein
MDIFIGNLVLILGTRYRDEIDDINMIGKKNFGVHTNGAQMFSGSIRYFCARLLVSEPVLIWFRGTYVGRDVPDLFISDVRSSNTAQG